MKLHHLEWDSNFFGYKVALIENENGDSLIDLLSVLKKGHYKLAYLFAPPSETGLNVEAAANSGIQVDTRMVLNQQLEQEYQLPAGVEFYASAFAEPELEELAIRSGIYSRFASDPRIGIEKFKELYTIWLRRSLLKETANETIVCRKDKKIIGFITLSIDTGARIAKIGLVAVAEGMEGKGIGTKLIGACKHYAYKMNCQQLEVVTQKRNESAMGLYIKNGFKTKEELNTFHFWI